MNTKNWFFKVLMVGAALILAGLYTFGNFGSNALSKDMSPEQVVKVFLNAAAKGDLKTIQAVHDPEIWEEIAPIWEGKASGKWSKMKVSVEKLTENQAVILIQSESDKSEWDSITLKKTNEGWRITY